MGQRRQEIVLRPRGDQRVLLATGAINGDRHVTANPRQDAQVTLGDNGTLIAAKNDHADETRAHGQWKCRQPLDANLTQQFSMRRDA